MGWKVATLKQRSGQDKMWRCNSHPDVCEYDYSVKYVDATTVELRSGFQALKTVAIVCHSYFFYLYEHTCIKYTPHERGSFFAQA